MERDLLMVNHYCLLILTVNGHLGAEKSRGCSGLSEPLEQKRYAVERQGTKTRRRRLLEHVNAQPADRTSHTRLLPSHLILFPSTPRYLDY